MTMRAAHVPAPMKPGPVVLLAANTTTKDGDPT